MTSMTDRKMTTSPLSLFSCRIRAIRGYLPLFAATFAVCTFAAYAAGGSIYAKGNPRAQSIASDDTARQVGDTLTITINETSKVANGTKRAMDKKSSSTAEISGTSKLGDVVGNKLGSKTFDLPTVSASGASENKFDGSADYDSERTVTDQITVVVQDVLPNGNLVVVGQRTRQTAGDTQTVTVSGIVRTSDVAYDNTVLSERVAEFHLVVSQKGQENNFTNPGWLSRALNAINPF